MKPTLRQLQYLVAIADAGSFSRAAKQTHVSQPSLSKQVKDMERVLGIKRTYVANAGKRFYEY